MAATNRILALDPARRTGWALAEDRGAPTYGVWRLGGGHAEAMRTLAEAIADARPDLIAHEAPIFSRPTARGGAEFKIKLVGAIELAGLDQSIPIVRYSPAAIKKWLTGSGNAKKCQVIAAIEQQFGISTADDNIADAIAILEMAREKKHENERSG